MVFTALVAIAALVLGAYATNKTISNSDMLKSLASRDVTNGAIITSDSRASVPAGYSFGGSLFQGSGYWTKNAKDMLHYRSDHAVIAIGDLIYIIGGINSISSTGAEGGEVLNSIVRYDTYTDTFDEMASLKNPRYRFAYALVGTDIYIFGGFIDIDDMDSQGSTDTMEVFSTTANTTSIVNSKMVQGRSDACADSIGDKIYVTGGYSQNYSDPYVLSSFEVYDVPTKQWSASDMELNFKRGDCRMATVGDTLYAIGGYRGLSDHDFIASTEACNPSTGKCTLMASMKTARGDFALTILPGRRIFVAGGEGSNGERNQIALRLTEEYIVDDNVWIVKAMLPAPSFRFDCAHVREMVYTFGGQPTCDSAAADVDQCLLLGLKSTYVYYDMNHPNLYLYLSPAAQ
jgi:hypothetical protein